ncbi:MAG TPA: hypothetical protein VHX86_06435 [Tepidisphaeraceae bacterium]|nr:hypothetical protein [Tepidisphaeraceae bacterium]
MMQLRKESLHPFQTVLGLDERWPSPWVRRCWTVFLNSPADVFRAIRYVQNNPLKEGHRRQVWSFVIRYDA